MPEGEGVGKKEEERRLGIDDMKSGGVTSETNQGMSLGLIRRLVRLRGWLEVKKDILEDYARSVGGICYQEVGEDEISEELVR